MDSGNSGSISSSGDEEYDSRSDTLPSSFLNPPTQFASNISHHHPQSSSFLSHHHQSLFDLSPSYLHALSQSQPNSDPNSLLNLDSAGTSQLGRRSEPNCTRPSNLHGPSSSAAAPNQSFLAAQDPSLQLRSVHDDNINARVSAPTNVVRNSKKRTRASRRAPTTVLTTDTSNFRAMVQEFTGIPAPPFSGSSYSRRLDLLAGSSSLRSTATHLETTGTAFYPLRPSAQKIQPNPLLLSTSSISSSSPSTLLPNNIVDAIASTTNISSSTTANSPSASMNYQVGPDLGLPYNQPHNMLSNMQNHPILTFQPAALHSLSNNTLSGFSAKSQGSLSLPSLEDLGMSHGQMSLSANLMSGVSVPAGQGHVANSEGMALRSTDDGYRDGSALGSTRDDQLRCFDGVFGKVGGGSCKLNFSASSSSSSFNHEKTLENNSTTRGEGIKNGYYYNSSMINLGTSLDGLLPTRESAAMKPTSISKKAAPRTD